MLRKKLHIAKWAQGAVLALLGVLAPARAGAAGLNHIESVKVSAHAIPNGGVGSDVVISTSEAARYSARLLDGGKRLLVDISDADVAFADGAISDRTGVVAGVLTQAFRQDGSRWCAWRSR
jgi:type IV pilus assembly protein PilQ